MFRIWIVTRIHNLITSLFPEIFSFFQVLSIDRTPNERVDELPNHQQD